jgi:PadR family transcriptional regulator, regulatory protein AphA
VRTQLTTTSYALLGLLNLEPFSAYDLAKYMQRSALSRLWPRTEASIYREPKTLVANGLARARTERTGKRTRTVYQITPAGRRAFKAWLRQPTTNGLVFECEAAVKVFFGDSSDLETLRAHLERLRAEGDVSAGRAEEMAREWMQGNLRFPSRLPYTVLAGDLIARVEHAVREWADEWIDNLSTWESTELHEVNATQARTLLVAAIEASGSAV